MTLGNYKILTVAMVVSMLGCASGPQAHASGPNPEPNPVEQPANREMRVAEETLPAGLVSLSEADHAIALAPDCRSEILSRMPPRPFEVGDVIEHLSAVQTPSPCVEITLRALLIDVARAMETEAIWTLRHFLDVAQGNIPESAPPMPTNLESLRHSAVQVSPDMLQGTTWASTPRFDTLFGRPVRFQYEIRSSGGTTEIIARGFPLRSAREPEELFVRVTQGVPTPQGSDGLFIIYRR